MIYSIGYQRLSSPDVLLRIAHACGGTVIDVRSSRNTHKRGFGSVQLVTCLGCQYEWWGKELGGRGAGPTAEGIERLAYRNARHDSSILMCMEEAPGECHRHHKIAIPLLKRGVDVVHIYRDELVTASALQAKMDNPDENAQYPYEDSPFAL